MKIFTEKVLGTVGWLSAICPLSGAMQPFYTTRGEAVPLCALRAHLFHVKQWR